MAGERLTSVDVARRAFDLTTVRQQANRVFAETPTTLLASIDDPDALPRRVAIDGPLIVRGSARLLEERAR